MSTESQAPEIVVARAEFISGSQINLILEDRDRTLVTFSMHPMASALLSLTLQPAMKMALAELEREHGAPKRPTAPDSPEGLEG